MRFKSISSSSDATCDIKNCHVINYYCTNGAGNPYRDKVKQSVSIELNFPTQQLDVEPDTVIYLVFINITAAYSCSS